MDNEKLYLVRSPENLEPEFFNHMMAMTGEGLHNKADIACELAYRDKAIKSLQAENSEIKKQLDTSIHAGYKQGFDEGKAELQSDQKKVKRYKDALINIVKHQKIAAGSMSEYSATLKIAQQALSDNEVKG